MSRERDSFDMFQDPQRGRFGENEDAGTGLIDLDLIHHVDARSAKAVLVSFGDRQQATWLPLSLIEIEETGEVRRVYRGRFDQKVRVTLPEWLAQEKGLI